MSINRIIGISCVAFGALLYFVLIPLSISKVSFTHLSPSFVPILISIIISIIGILLALFPGDKFEENPKVKDAVTNKTFLYNVIILIIYCLLIQYIGYMISTAAAMSSLLLCNGVRNIKIILFISIASSVTIWFSFRFFLSILLPEQFI